MVRHIFFAIERFRRHGLPLTALMLAGCSPGQDAGITSPDARLAIAMRVDDAGALAYRISHDGHTLIDWSPVGFEMAAPFGPLAIQSIRSGGQQAGHAFTDMRVIARETGGAHRRIALDLRAYDGGVAFRLVLPRQPNLRQVRIADETTGFVFPANALCLAVHQDAFSNSHEGDYAPTAADQLRRTGYYDLPLVCRTGRPGETFAITESGIEDYAGAYLVRRAAGLGVKIRLAPHPDDPKIAVSAAIPAAGLATPWRAVMVADRPERLIGSTLVHDLAAPSRIGPADWIRPGKAAWAWWSGMLAPDIAAPGHNDATYRRYIDFAARLGLPYYLIDRGWAWRGEHDDATIANVTRTIDGVDIPRLVAYARRRHVRLWLWVNWKALDERLDDALALYQRIGIAGIKVDYLDRQDQAMVAFYHTLLASAARHHLLVDIHAAFEPRGLDRTYPNFLTQEGVLGSEYNRWSRRVTAAHNVRLAYSRAIIGPMDYAPGAFRNVTPAQFVARDRAPEVMTTRTQQLAMTVVYPSPFLVLADAPVAYLDAAGKPLPDTLFLARVPTTWDETRGIAGAFGRWIAVARRKGQVWYIGVMNDREARTVALPLGFLHGGRWRVATWTDGDAPTVTIRRHGRIANTNRALHVRLAPDGGAVIVLSPGRG